MYSTYKLILFAATVFFLLCGCAIQKRRYMPGFYLGTFAKSYQQLSKVNKRSALAIGTETIGSAQPVTTGSVNLNKPEPIALREINTSVKSATVNACNASSNKFPRQQHIKEKKCRNLVAPAPRRTAGDLVMGIAGLILSLLGLFSILAGLFILASGNLGGLLLVIFGYAVLISALFVNLGVVIKKILRPESTDTWPAIIGLAICVSVLLITIRSAAR